MVKTEWGPVEPNELQRAEALKEKKKNDTPLDSHRTSEMRGERKSHWNRRTQTHTQTHMYRVTDGHQQTGLKRTHVDPKEPERI